MPRQKKDAADEIHLRRHDRRWQVRANAYHRCQPPIAESVPSARKNSKNNVTHFFDLRYERDYFRRARPTIPTVQYSAAI